MTPTLYSGLGVLDGCGSGIRIGASEEADDSPTSGAPLSISEGAEVIGSDSVTGNQEGAQNRILQTTYRVMEPIYLNRTLELDEESGTHSEYHPSLLQESQSGLIA